jgi:hypothetical protein
LTADPQDHRVKALSREVLLRYSYRCSFPYNIWIDPA